ncbi:MAG: prolipoprotein diacylglyceryl transferase family protein [bacterium]
MSDRISRVLGKIVYGLSFIVLLPLFLVRWADLTESLINLPVPGSPIVGMEISMFGAVVMLAGLMTLMVYGNGLPMNAYPPKLFVTQGIYKFLAHPIYFGFSLLSLGVSIWTGSASGFWLITPCVILGCVTLVAGYEKHDLQERFGVSLQKPLIALPADENRKPTIAERCSVYGMILLPWILLAAALGRTGIPNDTLLTDFSFEQHLPVIPFTMVMSGSTLLVALLIPLIARSARSLREFSFQGLITICFMILSVIAIPLVSVVRFNSIETVSRFQLPFEWLPQSIMIRFPSFCIIWMLLGAAYVSHEFPRFRAISWLWGLVVLLSCLFSGRHSLINLVGGLVIGLAILRIKTAWAFLRKSTERIANSWREWHFGSVRIINHGVYAGVGVVQGLLMIGLLLGPGVILPMLVITSSSLVMAALWAQVIEGSPILLRPYGFYGGVLGVVLGSIVAQFFGMDIVLLLAGFSVAGPWVQAWGRVRCLVQGCCHGSEAPAAVGIRYTHPRTRVCRLSGLSNIPIHPTPLYSILWNCVTGVMLIRLWSLSLPPTFICGTYLLLNGLGRFVEESYRGEPQTPIFGKLRLYQLIALLSIIAGAVMTTIQTEVQLPRPQFDWMIIPAALGFGLITWFALGVDFPNSNKRFSRLV